MWDSCRRGQRAGGSSAAVSRVKLQAAAVTLQHPRQALGSVVAGGQHGTQARVALAAAGSSRLPRCSTCGRQSRQAHVQKLERQAGLLATEDVKQGAVVCPLF